MFNLACERASPQNTCTYFGGEHHVMLRSSAATLRQVVDASLQLALIVCDGELAFLVTTVDICERIFTEVRQLLVLVCMT